MSDSGYINVSGGLITSQFVSSMQGDHVSFEFAHPSTFKNPWNPEDTAPDPEEYNLRVRDAFEGLKRRWDAYGHKLKHMNPEDARKYWQRPLLEELGFSPVYAPKRREISENLKFDFSHKGWRNEPGLPNPPVIHIIPPTQKFDEKPNRGDPAPHDALQGYLNTDRDKWAILTNGRFLRLLRDFHHTTVKGYIEFDIEAIFHNRLYSDFQALYRFAHASRFALAPSKKKNEPREIYLEEYFKHSQAVGESVGKNLRENVVKAIEAFGNGFLTPALRGKLRNNETEIQIYYEEILRIIYRIIFLLYAEQRGLIGGVDTPGSDLYLDNYSISTLRDYAAETIDDSNVETDNHTDLWEGLLVTFQMIREGVEDLDIYPYNGMLFDLTGDRYTSNNACKNGDFLKAIRYLTLTELEKFKYRQIISYADLSVEEFGSIYEGLLDYVPRITFGEEEIEGRTYAPNKFILDPRGSERKSTGSYYTNPGLVQQLIQSALVPEIESKLSEADDIPAAQEKALLSTKVCDPACGSGAFLIAACNKLGKELAKIRSGGELPSIDEERQARRDVLLHCIYGVDVNPMAVELAKVSLWINAAVKDKPLNFLDHHIKYGNSLIGATPELMEAGIPDDAFKSVEGDNENVSKHFKEVNKEQRKNASLGEWTAREKSSAICSREFAKLDEDIETTPSEVKEKRERYESLLKSDEFNHLKFLADLWTSAFFWPLTDENEEVPTNGVYSTYASNEYNLPPEELKTKVDELADEYGFFHWHLEFPDVFGTDNSGFDCVIGNPPWEKMKFQQKEFFNTLGYKGDVIKTAAQRKKLIRELEFSNPAFFFKYIYTKQRMDRISDFLFNSNRFTLTGQGDLNSYALFAELFFNVLNTFGYAGIVTQTGLFTNDTYEDFTYHIVKNNKVHSVYDFVNKYGIFKDVQKNIRFSLLTLSNVLSDIINIACRLEYIEDLQTTERIYHISPDDVITVNPNKFTIPMFESRKDASLIIGIYNNISVFNKEHDFNDKWQSKFATLFHMTNDSSHFKIKEGLEIENYKLVNNYFVYDNTKYIPLYESKFIDQYNHRNSTFEGIEKEQRFKTHAGTSKPSLDDLKDPYWVILPRYWVKKYLFEKQTIWSYQWLIGFRNAISSTADARSVKFCIIPKCAVGNSMPLIFTKEKVQKNMALVANFNSVIVDYVARQKVSGGNLNFYIVKQLPILSPDDYKYETLESIVSNVVELTYTAWDLKPFAEDVLDEIGEEKWNEWFPNNPVVDGVPQPFIWDEERRFQLKRELDAIYAHLYGISKEDLDYILDTFPIVKRKDEKEYGTYRTKDTIMEYYDKYQGVIEPVQGE